MTHARLTRDREYSLATSIVCAFVRHVKAVDESNGDNRRYPIVGRPAGYSPEFFRKLLWDAVFTQAELSRKGWQRDPWAERVDTGDTLLANSAVARTIERARRLLCSDSFLGGWNGTSIDRESGQVL